MSPEMFNSFKRSCEKEYNEVKQFIEESPSLSLYRAKLYWDKRFEFERWYYGKSISSILSEWFSDDNNPITKDVVIALQYFTELNSFMYGRTDEQLQRVASMLLANLACSGIGDNSPNCWDETKILLKLFVTYREKMAEYLLSINPKFKYIEKEIAENNAFELIK